jgi:hypothetical protein
MSDPVRETLLRQFRTASRLLHHHLDTLTTAECLWRPSARGLHVHQARDGRWEADWPDREDYDIGPPSIAWTTWHIGFWWSMVLDHSFGDGTLDRAHVRWPGDATGASAWIGRLETRWLALIEALDEDRWTSPELSRWPFTDRPFRDIVAWANLELTKNAAEIGVLRFLYAVRP